MSEAETEALARRCLATEQAAQGALAWFRDNPDRIAAQRPALEKEFRLHAVEARKLAAAARRPVAVGVYGLSQAGKSYLISTLARPPGRQLTAELDRTRGFLAEINPESEKEATGLVTRFTMRRERGPEGFPVRLRLLTETDLVKILANSWYRDARDPEAAGEVPRDELEAQLARFELDAATGRETGEIQPEDVWDLQTYCENEFRGFVTAQAFRGTFWDRAAAVLPRLPLERRCELYALLWNRFAPFTALLRRLAQRLRDLRFDRDAWAPIAALVPKTASVLSVDTLDHLHEEAGAKIEIQGASGARCTLTRPELTALIAELEIAMSELPWPIFKETDLLDFPGARGRMAKNHADEIPASPAILGLYYLRGKVAYLFERYAAERELNALLLCIKESNNDYDATIRASIRDWIARTHGEKPEDRARVATALFIVLTRMDMHFNRTPGRDDDAASSDLWEARVKSSLVQPLQEANGWLDAWHPGRPFDNTLLGRNPGRSQSLSRLAADGTEAEFLPGIPAKVERWGREFAAHPDIRRHVRDPERAWREVFKLNDAGMEYLVERLGPVCDPRLKLAQVGNQIEVQRATMKRRLSEWHVGDDLEAEHAKRAAAIAPALDAAAACGDEGRFAGLLVQFHLDPAEAREVLLRKLGAAAGAAEAPARSGGAVSDLLRRTRAGASAAAAPRRDAAQERAEAVVAAWIAKLRRFAGEPRLRGHFGFEAPAADALAAEMIGIAARTRLADRIAEALRKGGRAERFDLASERHAVAAAEMVAECVNYVGFRQAGALLADRPRLGADGPPAFEPPPPPPLRFEIAEEPEPYGALYVVGWIEGLSDAVRRNVYDRSGAGTVDRASNDALGAVLKLL